VLSIDHTGQLRANLLTDGVSLMDRKNVSNAYIAGMGDDLYLKVGYRYSLITLVFFITYVIFQPPMTYLCRKVGPPIFLPGLCMIWGIVILVFGFAKNWSTLGKHNRTIRNRNANNH